MLVMVFAMTAAPMSLHPQERPAEVPRLRAPWSERAIDHGLHGKERIRVIADVHRTIAMEMLERVETIRSLVDDHFGPLALRRPDAPRLLVFEDLAEMRFTLRTSFGAQAPETTALAIPHANGMVLAVTVDRSSPHGLAQRIQAEAFRHYALPRFPDSFPPWADHGLAEYYAVAPVSGRSVWSGECPPRFVESLQNLDLRGGLVPLERLIGLDESAWQRHGELRGFASLHAQSWGLVQFMLHGGSPDLARRFIRWLHQVSAGREPVAAFEERLGAGADGVSISDLEVAWRRWIRRLEPSPLLEGIERLELLKKICEDLENDGVRPSDAVEFVEVVQERPEVRHVVLSHPVSRTLGSHDRDLLDPGTFMVVDSEPSSSEEAAGREAPPALRLLETGPWDLGVEWARDLDEETWFPQVRIRRRRGGG